MPVTFVRRILSLSHIARSKTYLKHFVLEIDDFILLARFQAMHTKIAIQVSSLLTLR